MPPTSPSSSISDISELPTARFDAQDVSFVEPLREFLQQSGCEVVVNRETDKPLTYWICVGDGEFVKSIFERKRIRAQKILGIIYEGGDEDLSWYAKSNIKIYLVDPKPLTKELTREIFSFFFTGRANHHTSRKEPIRPIQRSVIPRQPSREPAVVHEQSTTDKDRIAKTMAQVFAKAETPPKPSRAPRRIKGIGRWIFAGCIALLTPLIIYGVSFVLAGGLLAASSKLLISGNVVWANKLIGYSIKYAQSAEGLLQFVSPLVRLVGLQGSAEDQERLLSLMVDTAKAESGVITVWDEGKQVAAAIVFPQAATTPKGIADVVALRADVTEVAQHLALVQAQLDSLLLSHRFPFQYGQVQGWGQRGLAALSRIRQSVSYAERLLTIYPTVTGFRKKQTYLVLLQNSMELRPTGGFIGSLLLVSFEDGKISNLVVQDVYTADGQLKGHIDPPLPIREILGSEHWYLRDSNWDPDFRVSGAQAAFFYEKEMNAQVDGVIAVSLPLVTKLLEVTGPIELSDFNERISASNLFAKSLLYTQTDFFPGSTQKKDFLGSLTNALLLRLTSDRAISSGKLLTVMSAALEGRDVQFYFKDMELERLMTQWGWAGSDDFAPCGPLDREASCISDGISVIEANLGVNKANYFMKQEALSRLTVLEDGSVQQALTLNMHNTSIQTLDGGGVYQVYLRLQYPSDTQFSSASVDGVAVGVRDLKQKAPPSPPYVMIEKTPSLVSVGIPLAIQPKTQHQVTVTTIRPNILSFAKTGAYQFVIRKQAGVETLSWHVTLHYPQSWNATSDVDLAKEGDLEYNTDLAKDGIVRVLFEKSP